MCKSFNPGIQENKMIESSRTGLVPAAKKKHIVINKKDLAGGGQLPKQIEAAATVLYLKPYGRLQNPFAKGCSVLCNHPVASDIKQIITKCKQSLCLEGKNAQHLLEIKEKERKTVSSKIIENVENIPEDLFRRYTDTDSRPLSPTPTTTSIHTRTSDGSFLINNRRCITPELGKSEMNKRKKLILDLRRSHSQETLYWKATSTSELLGHNNAHNHDLLKTQSIGIIDERKIQRTKVKEPLRPKSCLAGKIIAEEEAAPSGREESVSIVKSTNTCCFNDQDYGDENVRRGKRRKKSKTASRTIPPTTTTTTFHLSEDPETQISTIEADSLNASKRPSLIPSATNLLMMHNKQSQNEPKPLKESFLTEDTFNTLKRELDIDKIENCFDKCLNHALREAYRYLPSKSKEIDESMVTQQELKSELELNEEKLPRKFTKSATRFEVPMNLKSLETLTVFEYFSNFVWVSRQRKQLYKKVFLKYYNLKELEDKNREEKEEEQLEDCMKEKAERKDCSRSKPSAHDEYIERCISIDYLFEALEDALQFYGNEKNIKNILQLLDYENLKEHVQKINFRTWCGIVAFAERSIITNINSESDSCNELEKEDFFSLSLRLTSYNVSEPLRKVFDVIRKTHHGSVLNTPVLNF